MCVYRSFRNRPQLSPLPFPHFFSPRSAGNSASTFLLTIFASAFSLARRTQKFINTRNYFVTDATTGKCSAEGVPLRRAGAKTTGKVRSANADECGNCEPRRMPGKSKKPGNRGEWLENRPKQREDKRRYWGEVIPEGS